MLDLRVLYERLSTLSTERQKIECAKMKSELGSNSNDDLIKIFIDTVEKILISLKLIVVLFPTVEKISGGLIQLWK